MIKFLEVLTKSIAEKVGDILFGEIKSLAFRKLTDKVNEMRQQMEEEENISPE